MVHSTAAVRFSALQRAEIAEIIVTDYTEAVALVGFSALQRAEIAEIVIPTALPRAPSAFQCSSTSRNC